MPAAVPVPVPVTAAPVPAMQQQAAVLQQWAPHEFPRMQARERLLHQSQNPMALVRASELRPEQVFIIVGRARTFHTMFHIS